MRNLNSPFCVDSPIQRRISERLYVLTVEREGALEMEKGCRLEIGRGTRLTSYESRYVGRFLKLSRKVKLCQSARGEPGGTHEGKVE